MSAAPRTLLTTLRGAVRSRGGPAHSPRPRTAPANALQIRSLASAVEAAAPGKGWTREEVQQVYDSPLMELIFRAVSCLRQDRRPNHFLLPRIRDPDDWLTRRRHQLLCALVRFCEHHVRSFHAGLCPPPEPPARPGPALHSAQHQDWRLLRRLQVLRPVVAVRRPGRSQGGKAHGCRDGARVSPIPRYYRAFRRAIDWLISIPRFLVSSSLHSEARKAKANGSTRFCMGAAWRDMNGRKRGFERILKMVEGVRCVSLLWAIPALSQTLCSCDRQAYTSRSLRTVRWTWRSAPRSAC